MQPWRISEVNVQICSYIHPCLDLLCPSRTLTKHSITRGHWLIAIKRNLWALFFQQRMNQKIRVFMYREQPPSVNLSFSTYLFTCMYAAPECIEWGLWKTVYIDHELHSPRVRLWIWWELKLQLMPAGSAPEWLIGVEQLCPLCLVLRSSPRVFECGWIIMFEGAKSFYVLR